LRRGLGTTGVGRDAKGTDEPVEKRQRHRVDEPYLDVREDLEFGGGVATPPPDLRFRNLLKSAL
jgi:hypothetical protein